ncbi:reverse transcriptase domain-containing protein [Tanacetum coccineum]
MLRACPHHGFMELTQVDTFYNGLNENDQDSLNAATGGNLLSKTTRKALNIIENKSQVRYSRNKSNVSRMNTTYRESVSKTDERIDKLADQLSTLVEIVSKKVVTPGLVKVVEEICVTCSGPHAWYNCPNIDNNQASVCAARGSYNQVNPPNCVSNQMAPPGFALVQNNGQNRYNQNQGQGNNFNRGPSILTTLSGVAYEGPSILTDPSPKKTLPKPNIPYPSRRNDQKSRDKASNQMEKIFQIFQDLHFNISFADALLLMPRFAPTIKSLLMNKEKFLELAKIPLNENCSAMLLKKLPETLGDSGKFRIPCNFPGMDVCHALADLGASINLMPLFFWKKLSLPELTPTRMTLKLADRSITHLKGLAEDVFVKVGKFHFPTDFVVVDFEADPRTTRYSSTYDDSSINRIDIIDVACEEFSQEVLGFLNNFSSGNPTSSSEPILSSTTPSFTPFEGGYFILEEMETFLQTPGEFTNLDDDFYDADGDILYLEQFLNEDPSLTLPPKKNEDLKEVTKAKHSIEEPPEVELKDLPSHLEYAYLEENDKSPISRISCLSNLEKMLKRCEDTNLVLNWEKCRFMCREGIVLGHKISKSRIEVDRAKVDIIAKLPHSTTVKGVRSFLGHAGFYRRFIQDFSKIARPMTHLLEKETPFVFSKDCIDAFETLKKSLPKIRS